MRGVGPKRSALFALALAPLFTTVSAAQAQGWFFGPQRPARPPAPKQQPVPPPAAPQPPPKAVIPEDRPYDAQLFRLSEILGTLHYMRELCGANEGQAWREQMRELVASEGTSALRRAKLVDAFNRGYRDYSRTYRNCSPTAITAIQRFMDQAAAISDGLLASDK
jgi:uncharacterized protein (TIGR02301 family)